MGWFGTVLMELPIYLGSATHVTIFRWNLTAGTIAFKQGTLGLIYYNMPMTEVLTLSKIMDDGHGVTTTSHTSVSLIKCDIVMARATHQIQIMLRHPLDTDFENIVCYNIIKKLLYHHLRYQKCHSHLWL